MVLKMRSWRHKLFVSVFPRLFIGILFIYVYCEYLIYYVTQVQCDWPELGEQPAGAVKPVHAMVLADTHLAGSRDGHWFDKWRREWQMHRAFQTAMTLHKPEVIFVLGDLFDEGKWCPETEFKDYVERFLNMFQIPEGSVMHVVMGNHDVGFHYRMTPNLVTRFEQSLRARPVKLVSFRGIVFVLINSMAMERDGCNLCARATNEIEIIGDILRCSSGSALCKGRTMLVPYSRPILMQHYPLYRESDSICNDADAAPLPERNDLFEERWDCLSKESTEYLVDLLNPRAAFGGHTHHGCVVQHTFMPTSNRKLEFTEYTVPSFSWKFRPNPKYYLLTASLTDLKVAKCSMPSEWTIVVTAVLMFAALIAYLKYGITYYAYYKQSGKKV